MATIESCLVDVKECSAKGLRLFTHRSCFADHPLRSRGESTRRVLLLAHVCTITILVIV